jgi:hypothetical protein
VLRCIRAMLLGRSIKIFDLLSMVWVFPLASDNSANWNIFNHDLANFVETIYTIFADIVF